MSPSKPPWWRAFDKVERALGERLEDAAASNRYVDVMLIGMRAQRKLGGAVGRLAGGASERVLRLANIPTRSEIRRLGRQMAQLTSEVRELSAEQHEALAAPRDITSARSQPSAPSRPTRRAPAAKRTSPRRQASPTRAPTKRREPDDAG